MNKKNTELHNRYIKRKEREIIKFNTISNVIIALIFISFIVMMSLLSIFIKDKEFSEQENRNLNKRPEFTLKSIVNRDFSNKYTDYFSDQFPGRNLFMSMKSNIDKLQGENQINNVYIGKNSQLLNRFKIESEDDTSEKVNTINDFFENHNEINTSFMLVPTASKILESSLPKYAPIDNELNYINKVKSKLNSNIKFINVFEDLYNNRGEYIYFKTDHHWTSKGAYIAYRKMCNELGLTVNDENYFNKEKVTDSFFGSLSSKIGTKNLKADEIEVYYNKDEKIVVNYVANQKKSTSLFDSSSLEKKDKYEVFTGGNHPLINIKTLASPEKKLLIIKDSYANNFLPFLTAHYGEINVVDLRYYSDDLEKLIKDEEITDIMFLYNVNTFNEDDSILNLNN